DRGLDRPRGSRGPPRVRGRPHLLRRRCPTRVGRAHRRRGRRARRVDQAAARGRPRPPLREDRSPAEELIVEKVRSKAYLSPTLVLLAFDWADGGQRKDFLGFAIRRSPGYQQETQSWLPNRVGFEGPAPDGGDLPSNTSPIQKFLWWDA